MTLERQHGDLNVVLIHDRDGNITKAELTQPEDRVHHRDHLQLTADQLYALVDDVAVADPDTWSMRYPYQEVAELALRRIADYFRERAKTSRMLADDAQADGWGYFNTVADTFDAVAARCLEEIEVLYPPVNVLDHGADPTGEKDSAPAFKSALEAINDRMRRN